jgi:pseudaminic acid synthase|tara:strand:+ start:1036 stop:2079 length:1044 start_codon:yes stop_codon:yes gene_type:complete
MQKILNIFNVKSKRIFVVAEMSANHSNNIKNAYKIIDEAKKVGADAIKIQLYKADKITINSKKKDFKIKNQNWKKFNSLYNLYNKAETPYTWYDDLNKYCKKKKIILFSSVFDLETVDFLEKKRCPIYKIASPEITDIPLLAKVAKTNKPVIISSGLATEKDLDLAVKTLKKNKCKKIIILKCTSSYPAPVDELNLSAIRYIKKKYKTVVGFSDHSLGTIAPTVAVSFGAKVIEKHINLEKNNSSVDNFFSLNISGFKEMVKNIRDTEKMIGNNEIKISKNSKKNLSGRKSLYIIRDINKNEIFTKYNIGSIRPSHGLHPKYFNIILGKKSKKKLKFGQRMRLSYIK